jgi:uncharacterized protein (TIGR03435 family)
MRRWLILLFFVAPALLHGQAPDQKLLAFEVASIKPNTGGPVSGMTRFSGGRYVTRYRALKELIGYAYGVGGRSLSDRQIFGDPAWLNVDRFDIEATAPGIPDDSRGMIPSAVELRIRSLLEERCALVTHLEQRELPLYALVLARRDGRLGPGLRRRTTPCLSATGLDGTVGSKHMTCGGRAQPGMLFGTGGTIDNVAYGIGQFMPDVDRVVVDRTGLIGTFDFELTWTPESPFGAARDGDSKAPSLFTALQEQLGLKLEPTNGPVDVLVIDHVEHPTPD